MKKELRKQLETPFTPEQIKSRKGLWGKMLDYIEGHSVISRLNEVFDSDWSFSIVEHKILEDEVVVLGRLQVFDLVKEQFGSNQITRDSQTSKVLCLGENLKGAATDALKKCASLLGVGLHLYGENLNGSNKVSELEKKEESVPAPSNGNGGADPSTLITPKQKKYCLTLGRRANLDSSQVNKLCIDNYSIPLDELTKFQASELIAMLTA